MRKADFIGLLFTGRKTSKDYKRSLQTQVSDEVLKNVPAKSESWLKSLSTPSRQFDNLQTNWFWAASSYQQQDMYIFQATPF